MSARNKYNYAAPGSFRSYRFVRRETPAYIVLLSRGCSGVSGGHRALELLQRIRIPGLRHLVYNI